MSRITVKRSKKWGSWVVREEMDDGKKIVIHEYPPLTWRLAFAAAWELAVLRGLSIEGIS